MAGAKSNFFKDHYDWLVALVGLALLVGVGFLYVSSMEDTPEAASAACEAELKAANKPLHKDVPTAEANLDTLAKVEKGFKDPTLLGDVKNTEGSFLTSEYRVRCKSPAHPECRRPIPFKSEVCPWCKGEQPSEKPEEVERKGTDLDGDGMPDAWEKKYGLNPNNRDDADSDADGDLFSNFEEFKANTNPKDPENHPDYLDDLTIASDLRTEQLPFWVSKVTPMSGNRSRVWFEVTDDKHKPKTDTAEGEEVRWMLKNEKYGRTESSGWRVVKVEKKIDKVKKSGAGQEINVEKYSVVLQRMTDGRQISVPMGQKENSIEAQLDLQWNRGEGKTFTVAKGTEFELNKRKYKVEKLMKGQVVIVDLKTNEQRTIGDGASDQKATAKPVSSPKPNATLGSSPKRKSAP